MCKDKDVAEGPKATLMLNMRMVSEAKMRAMSSIHYGKEASNKTSKKQYCLPKRRKSTIAM